MTETYPSGVPNSEIGPLGHSVSKPLTQE